MQVLDAVVGDLIPFIMILSCKEIQILLECTERTALGHMKKIREKAKTTLVTKWGMADYLGIDHIALEISYLYKVKKDLEGAAQLASYRHKILGKMMFPPPLAEEICINL